MDLQLFDLLLPVQTHWNKVNPHSEDNMRGIKDSFDDISHLLCFKSVLIVMANYV